MIRLSVVCMMLITGGAAMARNQDGSLGIIRVPNNGQPAIVVQGDHFTVRARGKPDIFVDDGGRLHDLVENWRPLRGGYFEASVRVPEGFASGLYSIVGNLDELEDVQQRALLVLEEAPKQYYIAHIASPRIDARVEATLGDAFPQPSTILAVVTGDLTANGETDEYRALLDWLNTSRIPTIVAPGPHDSAQGRFGDYFDPNPYITPCGRDAVLTIGESVPHVGDDVSGDAGAYQALRPHLKPARWSLGVTGYAHTALSPRLQIVIFVDTPLHALVAGRAEEVASDREPATVVWDSFQGPTQIMSPVKGRPAGIQWIHVAPAGVALSESPPDAEP